MPEGQGTESPPPVRVRASGVTPPDVRVRHAAATDREELVRMRTSLWPDSEPQEVDALLARPLAEGVLLVAEHAQGGLRGFAEVGTRPYAEGCTASRVAYLEGIWVDPAERRGGIGLLLIRATEAWARERGLTDLASDTTVGNHVSEALHRAAGFEEVERIVCFRRELN